MGGQAHGGSPSGRGMDLPPPASESMREVCHMTNTLDCVTAVAVCEGVAWSTFPIFGSGRQCVEGAYPERIAQSGVSARMRGRPFNGQSAAARLVAARRRRIALTQ